MPKFVMLLHEPASFPVDISPEQMQAIIQRYVAWKTKVQQSRALDGHKLTDGQGRVMRGPSGTTKVTDGPYAEAREVIGGLFIVDAASYEDVVELCRDCPHLDMGAIEIREVEPT